MADDIVERLREEAMRLSGRSLDRGCADSGIASNLADEAADRVEHIAETMGKLGEDRAEAIMRAHKAEARVRELEAKLAEAYERAAVLAEGSYHSKSLADRSPRHIAAAIRKLAQEDGK